MQRLQSDGQRVCLIRGGYQVDMIRHQTEGVNTIPEPAGSLLKQEIKTVAIGVGEEDGLSGIAP